MINQMCICRTIPRHRYLDPNCPLHGDTEEKRRHLTAEGAELYRSLSPGQRVLAWKILSAIEEGRSHG